MPWQLLSSCLLACPPLFLRVRTTGCTTTTVEWCTSTAGACSSKDRTSNCRADRTCPPLRHSPGPSSSSSCSNSSSCSSSSGLLRGSPGTSSTMGSNTVDCSTTDSNTVDSNTVISSTVGSRTTVSSTGERSLIGGRPPCSLNRIWRSGLTATRWPWPPCGAATCPLPPSPSPGSSVLPSTLVARGVARDIPCSQARPPCTDPPCSCGRRPPRARLQDHSPAAAALTRSRPPRCSSPATSATCSATAP